MFCWVVISLTRFDILPLRTQLDAFAGMTSEGIFLLHNGGMNMKASVAIQSLPAAPNSEELIRIVDEVIDYIKSTGLNYYVGPFETTIEGEDYDQLMEIVKECQHVAIRAGAPRVSAYIKVVYEPEGEILTIDKKVTKHHQA